MSVNKCLVKVVKLASTHMARTSVYVGLNLACSIATKLHPWLVRIMALWWLQTMENMCVGV